MKNKKFYDDEFEDEEDYYDDPKIDLDEEVLMSFLNELKYHDFSAIFLSV